MAKYRKTGASLALAMLLLFLWSLRVLDAAQDAPPSKPTEAPKEAESADPKKPTESPIIVSVSGPFEGVANAQITLQVVAFNSGKTKVENIVLRGILEGGLMHETGTQVFSLAVGDLKPRESRTVPMTLITVKDGKFKVRVGVDPTPLPLNLTEAILQVQPNANVRQVPVEGVPQGPPLLINPNTPLDKLLPVPPRTPVKTALSADLVQIAEVMFEEPLPRNTDPQKAVKHMADTIAKIHHGNRDKKDGYMAALLGKRADLAGLPFVMGDACRQNSQQKHEFFQARQVLLQCMNQNFSLPITEADQAPQRAAEFFWENFEANCMQLDKRPMDAKQREHIRAARTGVLMQVCGPQSPQMRAGLVRHLTGVSHLEATRALARLAIFSQEEEVRQTALESLKVRREKDYTDIVVQALRYPLPAAASRAAEAVVKLQRADLVPELVSVLDEADPRAPQVKEIEKKEVALVREVVKINHHRNCLLCHAPGSPNMNGEVKQVLAPPVFRSTDGKEDEKKDEPVVFQGPEQMVTGAVAIEGLPLPTTANGYNSSVPELFVRVDVTYLRQDFSVMMPVAHPGAWPEMQRFDFLVRTRQLTEKEADSVREMIQKAGPSPYRQAAHQALRALTGQDAEPSSDAWRRLLKLRGGADTE